jgi:hypothetical protein
MPTLCIIPAAAVADPDLTDTQVRVLCAIGTFTNRLGGNVWASVDTLAKSCNLNPRTVQRAMPVLIDRGYLKGMPRVGRTTLYEVVLQPTERGVTQESLGDDLVVTPPPTQLSHPNGKKNEKKNESHTTARAVCKTIWDVYPKRETPHLFPPAVRAIQECLAGGAEPNRLISAAFLYADEVRRKQIEPRYVKTIHKFFADGAWEHYTQIVLVHGRTREEWARSGQDVAEFDRLVSA